MLPPALLAVTTTRMLWPTSAFDRVYCLLLAPEIAPHPPPELSQRSQLYAYDVGDPVHLPFEAVSSEPSRAVPEIVGRLVFVGAATTAVVVVVVVVVVEVVAGSVAADPIATEAARPAPATSARASTFQTRAMGSLLQVGEFGPGLPWEENRYYITP
ncbi:MAG: hypothetical protein ACRDLE_13820 [Gaiellaceae bacterium]